MILNNIKNNKDRGFTIVELLIVIVIIGILAAITIVSYTGITQRANLASAQSASNSVISKAEIYYADGTTSAYPTTFSVLSGATSDKTYALTGITLQATALAAAPTTPSTVNYFKCTTSSTVAGIAIGYWNYTTGVINYAYSGTFGNGTSTALPSGTTTCAISAT